MDGINQGGRMLVAEMGEDIGFWSEFIFFVFKTHAHLFVVLIFWFLFLLKLGSGVIVLP